MIWEGLSTVTLLDVVTVAVAFFAWAHGFHTGQMR